MPILPGFISDLHIDTASTSTVYAAVSGGTGRCGLVPPPGTSGIFMSTNGGAIFDSNLFNNAGAPVGGSYAFVAFAQSTQPNNQTIYTVLQDTPVANKTATMVMSTNCGGTLFVQAGVGNITPRRK